MYGGNAFQLRRGSSHANAVEARSRAFALGIERLLRAYGRTLYDQQLRASRRLRLSFSKGLTRKQLEAELRDLFERFGLAQMADGGRRATGEFEIHPTLLRDIVRDKEIKVRLIIRETERATRESLRRILTDALGEEPRPTQGDVARRIARQWFGPARKSTAGGVEQERLFSFERARTIARTELAQSENAGIVQGLVAAQVELVRWTAQTNDGKSGPREHWKMNDHPPIEVAAMTENDESGWFKLPSGIRTPYPQWSGLPAGETISCRCFTRAIY